MPSFFRFIYRTRIIQHDIDLDIQTAHTLEISETRNRSKNTHRKEKHQYSKESVKSFFCAECNLDLDVLLSFLGSFFFSGVVVAGL